MAKSLSLRSCDDIQDEISARESRIESLQRVLEEPDLPESTRNRVLARIRELQLEIVELQRELEVCENTITIMDIELTQGTQYFNFNDQGTGEERDNTVPLIEYRTLALRVYVNYNFFGEPQRVPHYIDATAVVDRQRADGSYQRVATLSARNGYINARSSSDIDRGRSNDTLNFRIPSTYCYGILRFRIQVFETDPEVEDTGIRKNRFNNCAQPYKEMTSDSIGSRRFSNYATANARTYAVFQAVPVFRLRGILIHYIFGTFNLPAPSGFDFLNLLKFVIKTYPCSRLEFDFTEMDFDEDLAAPPTPTEKCGPGWAALLEDLRELADQNDDNSIYVALVPTPIPGVSIAGCGGSGAAALMNDPNNGSTMSQEIGHAFGRKHAKGNGTDTDDDYPEYEGVPLGSIGEYGFDPSTFEAWDPATTQDFMGIRTDRWVSPYTYTGLMEDMRERYGDPLVRGFARTESERLILSFCVKRDGKVNVHTSFHVDAGPIRHDMRASSDIICELLDEKDKVLVFHRCHILDLYADADGPLTRFHEVIPWTDKAVSIRFLRGTAILHTHPIEEKAPQIKINPITMVSGQAPVKVTWSIEPQQQKLNYAVRYSSDKGKTWKAIAVRLKKNEWEFNPSTLPGGQDCIMQVLASSGIRTSKTEIKLGSLPVKPRRALILSPKAMYEGNVNEEISFMGIGFSPDFTSCDILETTWTSNIDGFLGYGLVIDVKLSLGLHTITFTVPDGLGNTSSATVLVKIKDL